MDYENFIKGEIPTIFESIKLSKKFNIPIHPNYTFYLNELSPTEFLIFLNYFEKIDIKKFEISNKKKLKRYFELLGVPHKLDNVKNIIIFKKDIFLSLCLNIGFDILNSLIDLKKYIKKLILLISKNLDKTIYEIINLNSSFKFVDKSGTYIGCRMGRPEKAKIRDEFKVDGKKLKAHGIFPASVECGRFLNIIEAYKKFGKLTSTFEIFKNEKTQEEEIYKNRGENIYFEKYNSDLISKEEKENYVKYKTKTIDIEKYINEVRKTLKIIELPKLLKGVSHTTSINHSIENLTKAFLREKNKIYVNKDGTSRYDMIEMGLTHFKPIEIGTSIEKLKKLGYKKDYLGCDLINKNQILEIFPQDVILPDCEISPDENSSNFILRVGNFVDELLEKFYGCEKFYNFKNKNDTLGHLIIGLAPHTSCGIIGRIIGYSKTQGCFSSPLWHAAQRRNLDGDENGIILLMDGLLNFSRSFLPNRRGTRTMDIPIVLTANLDLKQIDDEVFGVDIVKSYPKELYNLARNHLSPNKIKIKKIESKVNEKDINKKYSSYYFTHNINNFNNTIVYSSYKSIPKITEKMNQQLDIGTKIRAVNQHKVASLIIDKHFMKDIKGNLRKFGMQTFRCTNCNEKYRRPPICGKCLKCKKQSINFTISEGSIKKYIEPSQYLVDNYEVDSYLAEVLELTKLRIEGVFGKEEKEKNLDGFF